MGKKLSRKYPGDFKTVFGLSFMGLTSLGASSFMTSLFMLYLTDYSGIGAYAATLGTVLLLVGRIIDAVDDPLQGWLMDSTKPTKLGKYKPYIILSIFITAFATIALFALPTAIAQNPVFTTIWVLVFYIAYDIGMSFYADNPLKATLTDDPDVRAKITMWPRIVSMMFSMIAGFFLPILTAVNGMLNNWHTTFLVCIAGLMIPYTVMSLLGISMVKEGPHKADEQENTKISVKEIIGMFKQNSAQLVMSGQSIFGGFVWTLIFATATYYVKWTYCVDLNTGAVDEGLFGTLTLLIGMMQMTPILLGSIIAPIAMKKVGDPMKFLRATKIGEIVGCAALFILHIVGVLPSNPYIFMAVLFVIMLCTGMAFVPSGVVSMECMDYGFWKSGKEMNGICGSISKFIEKAQSALSSALVGMILIMIGYEVDSVSGNFVGELSAIPDMLTGFVVVCGLVPAILCLISWFILRKYPINNEVRTEMRAALAEMKKEK